MSHSCIGVCIRPSIGPSPRHPSLRPPCLVLCRSIGCSVGYSAVRFVGPSCYLWQAVTWQRAANVVFTNFLLNNQTIKQLIHWTVLEKRCPSEKQFHSYTLKGNLLPSFFDFSSEFREHFLKFFVLFIFVVRDEFHHHLFGIFLFWKHGLMNSHLWEFGEMQ